MTSWIESYAGALESGSGDDAPALLLSDEVAATVLDLARIVAHGTERSNAPLSTYAAGYFVGRRAAAGEHPAAALARAVEAARELLLDDSTSET
ncbi:MAG: DUF6457 domain-containing protein [Acidimicrobiia bacterium]